MNVSFNARNTDRTRLEVCYVWESFIENCENIDMVKMCYANILRVFEEVLEVGFRKDTMGKDVRRCVKRTLKMLLGKAQGFDDFALMDVNSKVGILCKYHLGDNW